MSDNKLTNLFLDELFQSIFTRKPILEVALSHLEYKYIPKEMKAYKQIYKAIRDHHEIFPNAQPSIGGISQQLSKDSEVQETLARIKRTPLSSDEVVIDKLERYIKDVRFQFLWDSCYDMYSKGEESDAIEYMAKESQAVHNMSLRMESGKFHRLFADFEDSVREDSTDELTKGMTTKVPFFIDPLDDMTYGGMDAGESTLIIMRSGDGKSTSLKWTALNAALLGYNVLHIQAEGGLKACRLKYDQIWTKLPFNQLKAGDVSPEKWPAIRKLVKQMEARGKDLYIYAYKSFDQATVIDVRDRVLEYHKAKGYFPDLIVVDSLNLLATGESKKLDTDPSFLKQKLK